MKKIISIFLVGLMLLSTISVIAFAAPIRKLDLSFVIDTTGSMSDDIEQVQDDMKVYLNDLKESGMDYRIAIVDYRDFASRTGDSDDYPYKVQLDFSNNYDEIISAINGLTLGYGGDGNETIFSALIDGLDELSWRSDAGKAAILMGDAPALNPEPITGYTYENVINRLAGNGIGLDDSKVIKKAKASTLALSEEKRSAITLFGIATSSETDTIECFETLANATGGKVYEAASSAEITDIIEEIIVEEIPDIIENNEEKGIAKLFRSIIDFFKNIFNKILSLLGF